MNNQLFQNINFKFNNNKFFAKHMCCHLHSQVFIKIVKYAKSLSKRFEFEYKDFDNQF